MTTIEKIKEMTAYELADLLFWFCLNCDGIGKGEIYRMLLSGDDENG